MTSLATMVRALAASGCSSQQIADAVAAVEAEQLAAVEAKRAKARDKKRRQRAAMSPSVPGTMGDNEGQRGTEGDIPPEWSPPSPKPLTTPLNPPSSLRSLSRTGPAGDLMAGFDVTVWPQYPNKVGKPAAAKAWPKAVAAAGSVAAIMEGLDRYVRSKPADRSWCNPATFLNQERWNDQPAPTSTGPPSRPTKLSFADIAREGRRIANERPDDPTIIDLLPAAYSR